jgi:hypothetical protein
MLTLSTLGCGALVAVLTATLARICSIGLPLPLAPSELLSSPLIRSATTVSLKSSKRISADSRQTLGARELS